MIEVVAIPDFVADFVTLAFDQKTRNAQPGTKDQSRNLPRYCLPRCSESNLDELYSSVAPRLTESFEDILATKCCHCRRPTSKPSTSIISVSISGLSNATPRAVREMVLCKEFLNPWEILRVQINQTTIRERFPPHATPGSPSRASSAGCVRRRVRPRLPG